MSITAGASPWPIFRDGLTSSLSYAFLAVKDSTDYNCIVWSPERKKLKFYPDADFWGITDHTLHTLGLDHNLYGREDYRGIYEIKRDEVVRILDYVRGQRGVTVVNSQMFLEQDFFSCNRQASRQFHPAGSRVPATC